MSAIKSQHSRVLEQLIRDRRATVIEGMALGVKRKQYHQFVGQLQGLDDALKLSEEADFKLNGEDVAGS